MSGTLLSVLHLILTVALGSSSIIILILWLEKLSHKEIKELAQDHTAIVYWNCDPKPGYWLQSLWSEELGYVFLNAQIPQSCFSIVRWKNTNVTESNFFVLNS